MNIDSSSSYLKDLQKIVCGAVSSDHKKTTRKTFKSIFDGASPKQQRKMMEWSIILNWTQEMTWCLKKGVSSQGPLEIDDLIQAREISVCSASRQSFTNLNNYEGWTPLTLALFLGHFKQVNILLDNGAKTDTHLSHFSNKSKKVQYFSPLFLSTFFEQSTLSPSLGPNFKTMVERFINLDPKLTFSDPDMPHFLMMSCITNRLITVFEKILPKMINLNEKDSDDETALEYFFSTTHIEDILEGAVLGNFFKVFMENNAYVSDDILIQLQKNSNSYPLELYLTIQRNKLSDSIPDAKEMKSSKATLRL